MKKVISMILMLVLVLSMSVTVFAAEEPKKEQTVIGNYVANYDTVYSVDIAWGSMEFTYEVTADVWDGENHTYTPGDAKWTHDTGANVVTVTNRSNAALNVAVTTDISDSNISASVTNGSFTLGSAAEGATTEVEGKETKGEAAITLSGVLTNKEADRSIIGSVIVTIVDPDATALTEEELNAAIEALKAGETVTLNNVSAADHAAIVSAVDETSNGALMSTSVYGLTTTYTLKATFTDALAAWTEGTTLTMLADVTDLTDTIYTSAYDLILDLNGHTLYSSATFLIQLNSGSLTVRDSKGGGCANGKLWGAGITCMLRLESGTVKTAQSNGNFVMTGGCISEGLSNTSSGNCYKISGGEINGSAYAIYSVYGGEIIITGSAKINGGSGGLIVNGNGTTIITGGTFNADPSKWVDTENYTVTQSNGVWTVTAR